MYLKSNSGEIKVYMVQPELAKTYDNKVLEMRLKEVSKGIKRGNEEDEKKEEEVTVKPKRKVGRYKLKFVVFANASLYTCSDRTRNSKTIFLICTEQIVIGNYWFCNGGE